MQDLFYKMIYKRKSFHIFTGKNRLTTLEINEIFAYFNTIKPLIKDIKIGIQIVERKDTTCKRGEYCILLFSEKKDNYLQNIGYVGEQLDLWLASKSIGVCWYGMGKTQIDKFNQLDFIIMLAIEKVDEDLFRKDMFKSKRKPLSEIWNGPYLDNVSNIVRFAPSACNTQPWLVENSNKKLTVFRYKKPGKRGMMPIQQVTFYNRIDIGIFLLFMEICLEHEQIDYERTLFLDNTNDEDLEITLNAIYKIY